MAFSTRNKTHVGGIRSLTRDPTVIDAERLRSIDAQIKQLFIGSESCETMNFALTGTHCAIVDSVTFVDASAGNMTVLLPDATPLRTQSHVENGRGLLKVFVMTTAPGAFTCQILPDTPAAGMDVTLDGLNQTALYMWESTGWVLIASTGTSASAPEPLWETLLAGNTTYGAGLPAGASMLGLEYRLDLEAHAPFTEPGIYSAVAAVAGANGNAFEIRGHATTGAGFTGGSMTVAAGDTNAGFGGIISIEGGDASTTGFGGAAVIRGGTSNTGPAGSVTVSGGNSSGVLGSPGGAIIQGGNSGAGNSGGGGVVISGGLATGTGNSGPVTINASGVAPGIGTGTDININGGGSSGGPGGKITISTANIAGPGASGAISLVTGNVTGAGANGRITFEAGNGLGATPNIVNGTTGPIATNGNRVCHFASQQSSPPTVSAGVGGIAAGSSDMAGVITAVQVGAVGATLQYRQLWAAGVVPWVVATCLGANAVPVSVVARTNAGFQVIHGHNAPIDISFIAIGPTHA
jgi:hypothetical protein